MLNAKGGGGRRLRKPRPGLTLDSDCVQDNVPVNIIDGIYIGSVHCAFNRESLAQYGITHILNISGVPATYPKNFTYLQVTMRDKGYANLLSAIPAANIFIESCIDSGGNVLVHCKGGRSRSAAFVCAFLMSTMSLGFDDAYKMVKRKRSVVSCNKGFELQLNAYGTAGWDVYRAHQALLRQHLEVALYNYKLNGSVTPRPLASCALDTPVRLCLTRPKGNTEEQVIPSLRGADMKFVCRRCRTPLFVTCSIVNISPSESSGATHSPLIAGKRLDLNQTTMGKKSQNSSSATVGQESDQNLPTAYSDEQAALTDRPPRLRRYYASATIAEPFGEEKSTCSEAEEDAAIAFPLSEPRSRRRSRSDSAAGGDNGSEAMDVDDDDQAMAGSKGGETESKEKQRWLSQMKALECDAERPKDRLHRPSVIARFDEQRAISLSESKHYFIEPMEWMGKLSKSSGPICCANEMCKLQVGRYDWGGLALEHPVRNPVGFGDDGSSKSGETSHEKASSATGNSPFFIAPAFRIEAGLVVTI
eukprot:g2796.t1